MRFYTTAHQYYCGIDLHARVMYLCIINSEGEIVLYRNIRLIRNPFSKPLSLTDRIFLSEWSVSSPGTG